jgi:hypothetical protein
VRWLWLVLLIGCAGRSSVDVRHDIAITIVPERDELPFDARGARLRAATEQLSGLLGHPVAIQIDAALVSELRSSFEHALIDAIEQTARGVQAFKRDEPEAFARTASRLRRIEHKYRPSADAPSSRFDAESGVLTIELSSHPSSLVPRDFIYGNVLLRALLEEDDAHRERMFAGRTPETVSRDELRAYFTYLTRTRPGYGNLSERARRVKGDDTEELASTPRGETIVRVVRIHDLAKNDPELTARARTWLFEQLEHVFAQAYENPRVAWAKLGPQTSFRRAEAAYVKWLVGAVPRATPNEKRALTRHLYRADPAADPYPGFDRFAFGFRIVEEWVRAGRPMPERTEDPALEVYDDIVCPTARDAKGEHVRNRGCASSTDGFIAYAVATDDRRKRLARALDEKKDAALADTILYTAAHVRKVEPDPFRAMLDALDPHGPAWRAGIDILARDRDRRIEEDGARLWAKGQRGAGLFLLAQGKRSLDPYYADEYWGRFAKSFGTKIDGETLAQMLEHGALAFETVPMLWPALASGFSRADVLVPKLDAMMPDARRTLSAIVKRMCNDGAKEDLAKIHAWSEKRSDADLAVIRRETAPGACRSSK